MQAVGGRCFLAQAHSLEATESASGQVRACAAAAGQEQGWWQRAHLDPEAGPRCWPWSPG